MEEKRVVKKRKKRRKIAAEPSIMPAVEIKEEMKEGVSADVLKVKRPLPWKQIAYFAGGAAALILGFIMALAWGDNRGNMLLAMGTIVFWPGGAYLLYRGIKKPDQEVVIVGADKPTGLVNSLNIYGKKDEETDKVYPEKVVFEWVDEPKGQPQQCTNNSKWYYVHIWDIATQQLKPFVLPDSQYFDPREFANVIMMPAHKRLFERQASMLQKIAPWVMVVAFLVSIFGLIATTPAGG